ncbi:MAG: succinate--CoA ligase subunit alpha [Caldisphaeraceae archaeon]|nr:succinate--CoA ligase subunit alpha [Caldisphaeraceae archaeon]MEB2792709.1 succinate--CoA ligase subunit alpha [Caldisphaeraceae archaeon]MEB3692088.1 succinate--CoA ligase subunit alpha [Caldisphaeraceae archaeon]MEB3797870.1 succinate--CoA ligase subunit alpha [Caldisphaeraceae archaeon]
MTILVDEKTRVIVQGITGNEGSFHTKRMLEYGTKIVAGVTPGKGGTKIFDIPVYDTVDEAKREHPEADTSIIFVPARFATDAVYEAIDSGLKLVVVITEHIPIHDSIKFITYARSRGTTIIGPNCPGIISPGKSKIGIMPGNVFLQGNVGIASRSGTLTYEISNVLSKNGIGQSTVIGVGGDPVIGISFTEVMKLYENDPQTKALVLIGEIGGDAEERAAKMVEEKAFTKPVVAFVAGKTAPVGKRMGHAGAIITMGSGSYKDKVETLRSVGIKVAETPFEIPKLVKEVLK